MLVDSQEYQIKGRTLRKLLKALVFSNNSTKRSLQHLSQAKENVEDPVRIASMNNAINNKRRAIKGNENVLRAYLDKEQLEKIGVAEEVLDAGV